MAKIPLRAYLKDVENLIERGEIEQAIAHAKNILRAYPKHIDTYRLLGKAFLESQRYGEAADILQRLLSVVPDDFVSQIGMSIIREDEGNLDASIWHMERAYEVQPFNPAVQDELRRLYGKRDGIEPPKIRLTRGALVRMYARGELYPQAIAETRAALAEDPQRLDLRVLLARLYYLSGQKNDAAEACSELIGKLPYCYEANRLLTEILPTTSRAAETPKFQQRIYALDPYEAFVSPSAPTSQQVPDQAVMVEPFIWEPGNESATETPEWTRNVGVAWEETNEEVLPDWLNTLTPGAARTAPGASMPEQPPAHVSPVESSPAESSFNQVVDLPADSFSSDDLVPDWMKDAGWAAADRSAEEIMSEQAGQEEEELRPAEIPDWLQSIAPPEAVQPAESEQERNDWLETILEKPAGENGMSTVIAYPTPADSDYAAFATQPVEPEEEVQDLPEWMAGLSAGTTAAEEKEQDGLPDWLSELGTAQAQDFPADSMNSTASSEGQPEWLPVAEELPEAEEQPEAEELPVAEESQAEAVADIPDWLQSLETEAGQTDTPTDWLQSLEVDAKETTPVDALMETAEPGEELAEWAVLEQPAPEDSGMPVVEAEAAEGNSQVTAASQGDLPPMPDMNDIEATMAWLEMLAARQGADEAELITSPEQRTDTPPDWLQQHIEAGDAQDLPSMTEPEAYEGTLEQPAAENLQAVEELPAADEEVPLPDWLSESEDAVSAETVSVEATSEGEFQAAADAASESAEVEASEAASSVMPDLADEAAAMAWLESLAARQGADEAELTTTPEERSDTMPDWVLRELESEEPTQPVEVSPHAETIAAGTAEVETEAVEAELPDWLRDEVTEIAVEQPALADETVFAQASEPVSEVVEEPLPEAPTAEGTMPDLSDMDAAMAWLESLAARQGADEAELTTTPEERSDTPPVWVQKLEADEAAAQSTAELQAVEEALPVEPRVSSWLDETAAPDVEGEMPFGKESGSQSWMESETPSLEEISQAGEEALEAPGEEDFEQPQVQTPTAEDEKTTEFETPIWLQDLEKEESDELAAAGAPDWLSGTAEAPQSSAQESEETFQWDAEAEQSSTKGEALPDWLTPTLEDDQPSEQAAGFEPMPDWLSTLEEEAGLLPTEDAALPTPGDYSTAWEPEISTEMVFEQPQEQPAAEAFSQEQPATLPAIQAALNRGDLDPAMEGYNRLIEEDQHLDEIIHDLRDVLYRYPVEISIWQTLGDAYAHNNQLQEALDAYTKAEELLR